MGKSCAECGADLIGKPSDALYCCISCASKSNARKRGAQHFDLQCPICGKSFRLSKSRYLSASKHYCSKKCMGASYRGSGGSGYKGTAVYGVCSVCGNSFTSYYNGAQYCSWACRKRGLQLSKEAMQVDVSCAYCGNAMKRDKRLLGKSGLSFCNTNCQHAYYKGNKHPSYKPDKKDINPLHIARVSPSVVAWRKIVFQRDHYTCQMCGYLNGSGMSVPLNAHHIYSFKYYPDRRTNVDNGITLCEHCHDMIRGKETLYEGIFEMLLGRCGGAQKQA